MHEHHFQTRYNHGHRLAIYALHLFHSRHCRSCKQRCCTMSRIPHRQASSGNKCMVATNLNHNLCAPANPYIAEMRCFWNAAMCTCLSVDRNVDASIFSRHRAFFVTGTTNALPPCWSAREGHGHSKLDDPQDVWCADSHMAMTIVTAWFPSPCEENTPSAVLRQLSRRLDMLYKKARTRAINGSTTFHHACTQACTGTCPNTNPSLLMLSSARKQL